MPGTGLDVLVRWMRRAPCPQEAHGALCGTDIHAPGTPDPQGLAQVLADGCLSAASSIS